MSETRKMIDMGNAAFFHLGVFAISIQDESIVSLFNFMPDHVIKVSQLMSGEEEVVEEENPEQPC